MANSWRYWATSALALSPLVSGTEHPKPIATVTVSPAPACPAPTSGSYSVKKAAQGNLVWGCQPGFVCSPPKPEGCAVWSNAPPRDYACEPQYCVRAAPYKVPNWPEGEIGYFPPNPGYFNLDPRAFGLTPKIFEKIEVVQIFKGETQTVTNPPAVVTAAAKLKRHSRKQLFDIIKEGSGNPVRRQISQNPDNPLPGLCFEPCDKAFLEAQTLGRVPALCQPGSAFLGHLASCFECISTNTTSGTTKDYLKNEFVGFIDFCEAGGPTPPSSSPEPGETGSQTFTTASQSDTSTTGEPDPITSPPTPTDTGSSPSPTPTTPGTDTSTSIGPGTISTTSTSIGPGTISTTSTSIGPGTISTTSTSIGPGTISTTSTSIGPGTISTTSTSIGPGTISTTSTSIGPGTISTAGAGVSGTVSRGPGLPVTTTGPGTISTAGADSMRQPVLATLFVILAPFFVF